MYKKVNVYFTIGLLRTVPTTFAPEARVSRRIVLGDKQTISVESLQSNRGGKHANF